MSDSSADNFDQASSVEETFREAAIKHIRMVNTAPSGFDGQTCYDCGTEIPRGRLDLGKWTCIACQTKWEEKHRQHRRLQ